MEKLLLVFAEKVFGAVRKQGGSDADLRRALEDDALVDQIAVLIVVRSELSEAAEDARTSPLVDHTKLSSYSLTLDYSKKFKQIIAAGKYDWVNDNITQKNFPINGEGTQEVEAVLVHFGKPMSSEAVLAEFKKMNFDPPNLETLLALGATQPELQKEFPIIALNPVGAGPGGSRCVIYLCGSSDERGLDLYCFGGDWIGDCRFLALRKRCS